MRLFVLFAGGWGLFYMVQHQDISGTIFVFFLIILTFFFLVRRQSMLTDRKNVLENFLALNENEVSAFRNPAKSFYDDGYVFADSEHLYSADLDIYGSNSLYHFINRCSTRIGKERLAGWMSDADKSEQIVERQNLVEELAVNITWLQRLQGRLLPFRMFESDPAESVTELLVRPMQLPNLKGLAGYARLAPYLMISSVLLAVFRPGWSLLAIIIGIMHLMLGLFYSRTVALIAQRFGNIHDSLQFYVPAIRMIEEVQLSSKLGKRWVSRLKSSGKHVSASISDLSSILGRLDARLNQFVGAVLNIVLLWDIRQIAALDLWQQQASQQIHEAFEIVGSMEAVGSLATLAFRKPNWTMPEIRIATRPEISASGIGHPLIPYDQVVVNDYANEDHQLGLITGSNMAGKSTFLRAIGVNGVLAYCGAPVCAKEMKLSVFQWVTYMRIRDSINSGTSTFMAELRRIEKVLNQVKKNKQTFVLLDELLRGTNSTDKYLGSKGIIVFLIEQKGHGLLATHDLKLSELEVTYPGKLKNYHFDIRISGKEMVFDYKLKPGPCEVFNASLLLERIGIRT